MELENIPKHKLNQIKDLERWANELTNCEIDISKVYDSALSFEENQKNVRSEVNRVENVLSTQKEVDDYNKESEYVSDEVLDKYYKPIRNSIDKLCHGYSNLVFVKGRGGIGKSAQIDRYLKECGAIAIPAEYMNKDKLNSPIMENLDKEKNYYLEINGELSEAYLYRILYVFNDCILWFRDVNKLLKTLRNIDTLKAATESKDKRLICNNNYSVRSSDIPRQFLYTGRIVFDFNSLDGLSLKEDFEALRTRGDFLDIALSQEDISDVMNSICKEPWQKDVTKYLLDNYDNTGWDLLNLRTQWKAFKTYEYCQKVGKEWKNEIKGELDQNMGKVRSLLYSLIGRKPTRSMELKKILLKRGEVSSLRTAHRRIDDWLQIGEIFKISQEAKNFYVAIDPIMDKK